MKLYGGLRWTKRFPQERGYYWFHQLGENILVYYFGNKKFLVHDENRTYNDDDDSGPSWWFGPIPEPEPEFTLEERK